MTSKNEGYLSKLMLSKTELGLNTNLNMRNLLGGSSEDPDRIPLNQNESANSVLGEHCLYDEDCTSSPYITCQYGQGISGDEEDDDDDEDEEKFESTHTCQHKKLFPLFTKEIIGIIIFVLMAMMSAAAGVGGGSIMVPILLIFFNFSTKEAVALTNGLIFFSGIVKFLLSLRKKHPKIKHRTIIEYNMVLIIIPSLLLGAYFGSTISSMLPELVQMAGLVFVLIIATYKGFKKSMAVYNKETEEIQKLKQKDDNINDRATNKRYKSGGKSKKNKNKKLVLYTESSADELGGKATDLENNLESGKEGENEPVIFGTRKARKGAHLKADGDKNELSAVHEVEMSKISEISMDHVLPSEGKRPIGVQGIENRMASTTGEEDDEEEKTQDSEVSKVNENNGVINKDAITIKVDDGDDDRAPAELPEDLKNFGEIKQEKSSGELSQAETESSTSSLSDGTTEESDVEVSEKEAKIHAQIRKIEGNNFYYKKFIPIVFALFSSLALIILRGGKGFPSIIGAEKCTVKGWILFFSYVILILCLAIVSGFVVYREQQLKVKSNWPFSTYERQFSSKFLINGNFLGFATGVIAANIGIGGGTIITPMMMTFNFLPQVISYTTMYLVVNNKLVSALVFFLVGYIQLDYLFFIGSILLFGVILIEWKVSYLMRRLGRQSFISFIFVGIMFLSIILVAVTGIMNTVEARKNGEDVLEFKGFCDD